MPRICVLVVEDEPLVRMDVADRLVEDGFDVHEASNADEAIRLLETYPEIRILFTDIDMPGTMDGLKLSAFVRDRWPPVRIVVTSGHRIVDVVDLPDGGVFYSKPYKYTAIVQSFRELVAHG